jgi:hypothetical protein
MPKISQLFFMHGEGPEEIVKALERSGLRVDVIFDSNLLQVYPEDHSNERTSYDIPEKGEYLRDPLNFNLDKVIIVLGAPGGDMDQVYYAQTYV